MHELGTGDQTSQRAAASQSRDEHPATGRQDDILASTPVSFIAVTSLPLGEAIRYKYGTSEASSQSLNPTQFNSQTFRISFSIHDLVSLIHFTLFGLAVALI